MDTKKKQINIIRIILWAIFTILFIAFFAVLFSVSFSSNNQQYPISTFVGLTIAMSVIIILLIIEGFIKRKSNGKKINSRLLVSFLAVVFAIVGVIIFITAPAIKIDQSYAFKEQINAFLSNPIDNVSKLNFYNLRNWEHVVSGFKAMFGIGTYDVYIADIKTAPYDIFIQQDKMSFNYMMLIGALLGIITSIAYLVVILTKKKSAVLNKVIMAGFILSALLVVLSAVWFYMVNPIEESNYYSTVTKLDTNYKYMNAHLSWGPIVSATLLGTSGVLTAFGEY